MDLEARLQARTSSLLDGLRTDLKEQFDVLE